MMQFIATILSYYAALLCEFESDKIQINKFQQNRSLNMFGIVDSVEFILSEFIMS